MAKDLNKVQIIGRLGADPEMRYLASGSAVTTFKVASGRQWTDRDGTRHEETEWFRVVAWEKLGEICNQYLTKGARVYIEGRLQTRKWTDKDGQDRYTSEVIAQDMIMLDTRRGGQEEAAPEEEEAPIFPPEEPAPAPARAARPLATPRTPVPPQPASRPAAPRRNQPQPIETDDDIPF